MGGAPHAGVTTARVANPRSLHGREAWHRRATHLQAARLGPLERVSVTGAGQTAEHEGVGIPGLPNHPAPGILPEGRHAASAQGVRTHGHAADPASHSRAAGRIEARGHAIHHLLGEPAPEARQPGLGHRVAVADRANAQAILDQDPDGAAEPEFHRLAALVVIVVEHRHLDLPLGLARVEAKGAAVADVVLPIPGRAVAGVEVDRHDLIALRTQANSEYQHRARSFPNLRIVHRNGHGRPFGPGPGSRLP